MTNANRCPFCQSPRSITSQSGATLYRCGTVGPVCDEDGKDAFDTGTECDKTCFGREVIRLSSELETFRRDWCEEDTKMHELAKQVLPAATVDGDSWQVPRGSALMELVVAECKRLRDALEDLLICAESHELESAEIENAREVLRLESST